MIAGLDTGERAGKTVACYAEPTNTPWNSYDADTLVNFDEPLDAIDFLAKKGVTKIVVENSAYAFSLLKRQQLAARAVEHGIELFPIDPKHTKNRRADHGIKKDDRNDAWTLLQIGLENILPAAGGFLRPVKFSVDPVVRIRQLGYDFTDPRMDFPGLKESFYAIAQSPIPAHAFTCGAATQLKTKSRWELTSYRFATPLIKAVEIAFGPCPSFRRLKSAFRQRGIARSNMRFHPLHKKPRQERKEIMRAQDQLARWMLSTILTARRQTFAA